MEPVQCTNLDQVKGHIYKLKLYERELVEEIGLTRLDIKKLEELIQEVHELRKK